MRILPRSAKGTWLLAAAVWVAGCAGAWLLMPVAPRAEWRLPESGRPVGFLPDRDVLVTAGGDIDLTLVHGIRYEYTGPIRLWDIATGRLVGEFPLPKKSSGSCTVSRTGRWLALTGGDRSCFLLDLGSGHWLADPPDDRYAPAEVVFDATDRYVLARYGYTWRKFSLPDLIPTGAAPDSPDTIVARDAGIVAGTDPGEPAPIHLWDAVNGRSLPAIRLPENHTASFLTVTDDGKVLAACIKEMPDGASQLACWDVATGRRLFADAVNGIPSLGRRGTSLQEIAVNPDRPDRKFHLTVRDLPNGAIRSETDLPSGVNLLDTPALRSPDGRTLLLGAGYDSANLLREWVQRIGLRLPWDGSYRNGAELIAADTGQPLGFVNGAYDDFCWSPDGSRLATMDPDHDQTVLVWDIPPRKPLTWFSLAAAVLALPLAALAWRRSRRLRRERA